MRDPNDDEFYDSIDGSNSDVVVVVTTPPTASSPSSSDLVPLYNGETCREHIARHQHNHNHHQQQQKCRRASEADLTLADKLKTRSSYLSLLQLKKLVSATRSCANFDKGADAGGEVSSDGSNTGLFEDARDGCEDTASFYELYVRNSPVKEYRNCLTNTSSVSSDSLRKMTSVSQQTLPTLKRKKTASKTVCVPVQLGGLGPDLEAIKKKQEFWRRRVSYGQKVSEENRAKLTKERFFKQLKDEPSHTAT